jgi:predicted phage terminase large subunit-like protein
MQGASKLSKTREDALFMSEKIQVLQKLKQLDLSKYDNLNNLLSACHYVLPEDEKLAVNTAKMVNDLALRYTLTNGKFYELYNRSLLFLAPYDFDSYMLYVEKNREPSKRFWMPRRKVLLDSALSMQALIDDDLDLLTISMPPGAGKSTLGIFFLSWVMGKFPDQPNLASAHADKLTRSFYDGVMQIITDPEYLWSDVFSGVKFESQNAKDETINLGKAKRFKTLTARSIDGSLTGATRCEKILYADDLCSGIEEAMSKERLDKLWEKYTNDLKSRKKLGCKEIHIATRWSVHDVIGRLEQQYGEDPKCKFIVLPALDENDESNFNYDYGVGFDSKYFLDMKNSLDDVSWRCLFMNQPVEREGLLYHDDELRRYFEIPKDEPDAILGICDTKDTGTDYEFLPVVYQYGNDFYLEDCICDNANTGILDERCARLLVKHSVKACRFESNNAGGRTADTVQQKVKDLGGVTHITKRFTTSNKETKIIVNAQWVKDHVLFKDKTLIKPNTDYSRMMKFLTSYSMKGKNKNDDVPDGMAQLALFVQSLTAGQVKVFARPF